MRAVTLKHLDRSRLCPLLLSCAAVSSATIQIKPSMSLSVDVSDQNRALNTTQTFQEAVNKQIMDNKTPSVAQTVGGTVSMLACCHTGFNQATSKNSVPTDWKDHYGLSTVTTNCWIVMTYNAPFERVKQRGGTVQRGDPLQILIPPGPPVFVMMF